MTSWRRALAFGFLVWLIPFAVSFALFPLKESWRSLFESAMAVTVAAATVVFSLLYFRCASPTAGQGLGLGILWLAVSVLIDLPLMLSPPLNYSPVEYAADVGLTYLMMPIVTVGIAIASRVAHEHAPSQDSAPNRGRR